VARLGVEVGDAIDNPAVRAFLLNQGVSGEALNVASNVSGVVRTKRLGGSAGRVAADGGDRSTCAGRCGLWDGLTQLPLLTLAEGRLIKGDGTTIFVMEAGLRRDAR
jgi:hypothetical protein